MKSTLLILCMFIIGSANDLLACEDDLTDYSVSYLLANYTPCGGHWWAKSYKCNGDTQ